MFDDGFVPGESLSTLHAAHEDGNDIVVARSTTKLMAGPAP